MGPGGGGAVFPTRWAWKSSPFEKVNQSKYLMFFQLKQGRGKERSVGRTADAVSLWPTPSARGMFSETPSLSPTPPPLHSDHSIFCNPSQRGFQLGRKKIGGYLIQENMADLFGLEVPQGLTSQVK